MSPRPYPHDITPPPTRSADEVNDDNTRSRQIALIAAAIALSGPGSQTVTMDFVLETAGKFFDWLRGDTDDA